MVSIDDPIEKEDGGLDLDHPVVLLFRQTMLAKEAEKEGSKLYCPKGHHLPERWPFAYLGADFYCSLCDSYFKETPKPL
jgi:hypothetical protein